MARKRTVQSKSKSSRAGKEAKGKSRATSSGRSSKSPSAGHKPWQRMRPAKLARARKLLKDRNYPSDEVIRGVAGVLASHLQKQVKPSAGKETD